MLYNKFSDNRLNFISDTDLTWARSFLEGGNLAGKNGISDFSESIGGCLREKDLKRIGQILFSFNVPWCQTTGSDGESTQLMVIGYRIPASNALTRRGGDVNLLAIKNDICISSHHACSC